MRDTETMVYSCQQQVSVVRCYHRRTGQHPVGGGGGQTEFFPNGFSGGG